MALNPVLKTSEYLPPKAPKPDTNIFSRVWGTLPQQSGFHLSQNTPRNVGGTQQKEGSRSRSTLGSPLPHPAPPRCHTHPHT